MYDEAVRCNDKAIQLRPKDEAGYFNKGMCMLNKIYSLTRSTFVLAQKQFCIETVPLFKKVL